MSTVIRMTREEVVQQREDLLRQVGMTYEQLHERAARYQVTMDELLVWDTIEGLDYLLEGD